MAYIGKSPDGTGVRSRFYYTQSSGGGTSVTGSSDDGTSLAFSDGAYVDVFLNGVLLVAGTDYNTNTANTIAGLAALANGDVIEVVVYDIFTVADTVSSLNGGTFAGNVVFNGTTTGLDLNGTELVLDADGDTSITADTDDQIDFRTGGSDRMIIDSSGNVGIGMTPSRPLHVQASSGAASIYVRGRSSDGTATMLLHEDNSGNAQNSITGYTTHLRIDAGTASDAGHTMQFYVNDAERMRLDEQGDLGIGGTPGNIRFKISNTENKITQFIHTSNGSYSDNILEMETARGQSDVFNHILIRTNNGGDAEFKVRGDGQVTADGAFTGGGADYAEYFEWADGNSSNEDRRGYSVVLDGNKIRKATSDDAAASIIGIVSANPAVVGDSRWNKWHGKHEMDDYGTVVTETCSLVTWTEASADETAAPVTHTYYTDRVPDGITVPDDAVVTANQTRPKESASYDASVTYVPREKRKEWDAIGMMGKLRMRKGQPTGDRWLKLRDISSDVEEWLVR